jgi:transposase
MLNYATGFDQIYLVCGYTDLRKGIDGLSALVTQKFSLNPFSNILFLFCGRRTDRIKALLWEGDGFVMLYKRLENGKYQWPRNEESAREITSQEFRWLIEGLTIEPKRKIKKSSAKRVC